MGKSSIKIITKEQHRGLQEEAIGDFIEPSKIKILLLNEPVGYGKTKILLRFISQITHAPFMDGNEAYKKMVVLTKNHHKAKELEDDINNVILGALDGATHYHFGEEGSAEELKTHDGTNIYPARVLRIFGEEQIQRFSQGNEIKECTQKLKRETALGKNESAWKICESCDDKLKCPYFKVNSKCRNNEWDILVGVHAELQNEGFYQGSKIKHYDYLILDENGHESCHIKKVIKPAHLMEFLNYFISELEGIDANNKHLKNIYSTFVEYKKAIENPMPIEDNFKSKGLGHLGEVNQIQIVAGEKKEIFREWASWIRTVKDFAHKVNLVVKKEKYGPKAYFVIYPSFDGKKVVIADATTTKEEMLRRFDCEDSQLKVSYDYRKGIICPKGDVFQVVENLSNSYFAVDGKNIENGLDEERFRAAIVKAQKLCGSLKFSPNETYLILPKKILVPYFNIISELVSKPFFKHSFKVHPEYYHGNVRGLNKLKDKDLVIMGSNFPTSEAAITSQEIAFGSSFEYDNQNLFLSFNKTENGPVVELEDMAEAVPRTKGLLGKYKTNFCSRSQKKYVETVVQSIRSRFFYNKTKTLIICPFSLIQFGIAPSMSKKHTIRQYKDGIYDVYEKLKMNPKSSEGYSLVSIAEETGYAYKGSLKAFSQRLKRAKLVSYTENNRLYIGERKKR